MITAKEFMIFLNKEVMCEEAVVKIMGERLSGAGGWGAAEKGYRRAGKRAKEAQGRAQFQQRLDQVAAGPLSAQRRRSQHPIKKPG